MSYSLKTPFFDGFCHFGKVLLDGCSAHAGSVHGVVLGVRFPLRCSNRVALTASSKELTSDGQALMIRYYANGWKLELLKSLKGAPALSFIQEQSVRHDLPNKRSEARNDDANNIPISI
jgi:hypothetical protein